MKLIHSYSALADWQQCPRLHKAKYIDKQIKFVETDAIKKGNYLHSQLEHALHRKTAEPPLPDQIAVQPGLWSFLLKAKGFPEEKLAFSREGAPCTFFDNARAWLRGKIDVRVPIGKKPDSNKHKLVFNVDWKTGNPKYTDPFQAEVYGALEYATTRTRYSLFVWQYVTRDPVENPEPQKVDNAAAYDKVVDLMLQVEADDEHPPRPSWKCRFCDVKTCEYNENRR